MKWKDFKEEFPQLVAVINGLEEKILELEGKLAEAEKRIEKLEKEKE
jgi:chromosome segregation ATPase